MTIEIANNELSNCNSIDDVVELINGGDSITDCDVLAAKYSIDCSKEDDFGINDENLSAHLEILESAGANFNFAESLGIAIKNV